MIFGSEGQLSSSTDTVLRADDIAIPMVESLIDAPKETVAIGQIETTTATISNDDNPTKRELFLMARSALKQRNAAETAIALRRASRLIITEG